MSLSPRQVEVLKLLCTGLQNKQVAYELGVTERVIEVHRQNIMIRSRCDSAVQLGVWAAKRGYA